MEREWASWRRMRAPLASGRGHGRKEKGGSSCWQRKGCASTFCNQGEGGYRLLLEEEQEGASCAWRRHGGGGSCCGRDRGPSFGGKRKGGRIVPLGEEKGVPNVGASSCWNREGVGALAVGGKWGGGGGLFSGGVTVVPPPPGGGGWRGGLLLAQNPRRGESLLHNLADEGGGSALADARGGGLLLTQEQRGASFGKVEWGALSFWRRTKAPPF